MRSTKYVPTQAKGKGANFTGHLEVEVLPMTVRYKYLEECQFAIDDSGQLKMGMSQLGATMKGYELTKKHIKMVEMKHKDGTQYEDLSALESDPRCDAVLIEVSQIIMQGLAPSKN